MVEEQVDIKKMSVVELKALAFDFQVKIQLNQNNLQVVLQELQSRPQEILKKISGENKNGK